MIKNFSVLMSIYASEKVEYFDAAMISIWYEQTIKPNEIILVLDGPLTTPLYNAIKLWQKQIGDSLIIVPLLENVGLGKALNLGLERCSYDLVARMDTDDISMPYRFKEQLLIFENDSEVSVCGSSVSEFDGLPSNITSYRILPTFHDEIVRFAKTRNPINHPSVMYKKSVVLKAGGYKHMLWLEDYYLWVRMICIDAKFYNINEPLVNMRAGYAHLQRRTGLKYLRSEIELNKRFLLLGFIDNSKFLSNILIRFITRLMPSSMLKIVYKLLR